MKNKLKFNSELEFICNLIFDRELIDKKKIIRGLNEDKLVKIASSYLILPLLYNKLKQRKLLNYFQKDLKKYLKFIFEINKERNIELLSQVNQIEKILTENDIKYRLLKGVDLIKNKVYEEIGERMIGDIDIYINKKNRERLYKILLSHNYTADKFIEKKFLKQIHLPRFVSKDFIGAIEPHFKIIENNKLNEEIINDLNNKEDKAGKVDYMKTSLKICTHSYMINEKGYFNATFSLRNIYDIMLINRKLKSESHSNEIKLNHNLIVSNLIGITDSRLKLNICDKIFMKRLILKNNSRIYLKFDQITIKIILGIKRLVSLFLEFITNKELRKKKYRI